MDSRQLQPGDVVTAKATSIQNYGVFFEYNKKTRILVLITNMSKERVSHPGDLIRVGDDVKLRILRYNDEEDAYVASLLV